MCYFSYRVDGRRSTCLTEEFTLFLFAASSMFVFVCLKQEGSTMERAAGTVQQYVFTLARNNLLLFWVEHSRNVNLGVRQMYRLFREVHFVGLRRKVSFTSSRLVRRVLLLSCSTLRYQAVHTLAPPFSSGQGISSNP